MFTNLTVMNLGLTFTEEWRVQICNLLICIQGRIILFFFFLPVESPLLKQKWFYIAFRSLFDILAWKTNYWTELLWSSSTNMESFADLYEKRQVFLSIKIKYYSPWYLKFLTIRNQFFFQGMHFVDISFYFLLHWGVIQQLQGKEYGL